MARIKIPSRIKDSLLPTREVEGDVQLNIYFFLHLFPLNFLRFFDVDLSFALILIIIN